MQIERLASRRFAFLRLREQAHTSKRIHKVQKSGLLRTACFRNPTCIRNPSYRSTCSYRLARPMFVHLREQAHTYAQTLDGTFIVHN